MKKIIAVIAAITVMGCALTVSAATSSDAQKASGILNDPIWYTVEKGANW